MVGREQTIAKAIDVVMYFVLLSMFVVVPLFLDIKLVNNYVAAKQYAVTGLLLLITLLFATRVILAKRIVLVRSFLDAPIFLFLVGALLSTIFSVGRYDSLLGNNAYFVSNFVLFVFLALFYFLFINIVSSPRRWQGVLHTLTVVGGLTALFFILKAVFHVDVLAPLFGSVWNTIDVTNSSFGVWLVIVFMMSAGKMISRDLPAGWLLVYFLIAVLSFASVVLLGYAVIWWILLIALALLLVLGVSFLRASRVGWLSVLFMLFVAMVGLIIFDAPRSLQPVVPAEVVLNLQSSWAVSVSTLSTSMKNLFVGSGLGTFGVDFSEFRDVGFNNDRAAWSLRFNRPYSTALAMLAEGGLVTMVLFGFLGVLTLGYILANWFHIRKNERNLQNFAGDNILLEPGSKIDIFLVGLAWAVLCFGMLFVYYGPALWWLWFALLSLTVVGLSFSNNLILKVREFTVAETPQYSLAFSFVAIIIMAAIIMLGVWGARFYLAERHYAAALRANNYAEALQELNLAVALRKNSDTYHVGLAQVYLSQAIAESRVAKPDLQKISNLLGLAVNEARVASDLSPRSVAIWENLSMMYENAAVLVPGAREWAIKSLQQARALEPTNPVLAWRLGNNFSLGSQWEDAIKQYQEAIDLKRDYLGAYSGLANAYEQVNKIDKAIQTYQSILGSANNNIDILFNYGRLLYNRNQKGDRDQAATLWQQTIKIQPNYSNALYSLGLYYEARGDRATALQYYYKVKDFNPDNKDITTKIRSLVSPSPVAPVPSTPVAPAKKP